MKEYKERLSKIEFATSCFLLKKYGLNQSEIAKLFGCSQPTIGNYVKKYEDLVNTKKTTEKIVKAKIDEIDNSPTLKQLKFISMIENDKKIKFTGKTKDDAWVFINSNKN